MIVNFSFNCDWDLQKKERISHLLSERLLLLVGIRTLEKINSITFCAKEYIEKMLLEHNYLLSKDRFAILYNIDALHIKTYELVMDKDILLSMLTPGTGQSIFDNLMLELKHAVQSKSNLLEDRAILH